MKKYDSMKSKTNIVTLIYIEKPVDATKNQYYL